MATEREHEEKTAKKNQHSSDQPTQVELEEHGELTLHEERGAEVQNLSEQPTEVVLEEYPMELQYPLSSEELSEKVGTSSVDVSFPCDRPTLEVCKSQYSLQLFS